MRLDDEAYEAARRPFDLPGAASGISGWPSREPAPATAMSDFGLALRSVPSWVVLLFAALLVRAVTFGNPIVHNDEQFYFVAARAWLDGALPYVGVWDRK